MPLEVKPDSRSRLSALVDELRRQQTSEEGKAFALLADRVPVLHFMSMSVFDNAAYDPIFILEANFDGSPGVFWGQMEAVFGEEAREMLRCCKPPLDGDRELYLAVTAAGSRVPLAPYFEARTQWPSVFHQGNRGLARDRILAEAALFGALREALDTDGGYRALSPADLRSRLRATMTKRFPWLAEPGAPRILGSETAIDALKLLAFVLALILVLSLPGLLLGLLLPLRIATGIVLVAALIVGWLIWKHREPLPGTGSAAGIDLVKILLSRSWVIAGYLVAATAALVPVYMLVSWILGIFGYGGGETGWREAALFLFPKVVVGLLSLLVTVPLLVLWLRWIERKDSSSDAPPFDEDRLKEISRREDWIVQNHMGSIVLIRPGVLRTLGVRVGHLGLGLVLRVTARSGYLGSMRTVHFAHWAFLNNQGRLMFMSNFDHSWDSYLDDFIEKAHGGLTLAWGCGVGFPPTRFLLYDGASHGRQFKQWALASRAVSRFWYSAYPELTVDQIERNFRIAEGLRKPAASEKEALAWMEEL